MDNMPTLLFCFSSVITIVAWLQKPAVARGGDRPALGHSLLCDGLRRLESLTFIGFVDHSVPSLLAAILTGLVYLSQTEAMWLFTQRKRTDVRTAYGKCLSQSLRHPMVRVALVPCFS